MDATTLLKELQQKKYRPIYLLHGEEDYFIDLITDYIAEHVLDDVQKGFDQTILYGKDSDFVNIVNASKRYPMLGTHQVMIVKEAQSLKWKNDEELLYKYAESPTPTTILVLAYKHGKFDKRKKVYKTIEKAGAVMESARLYEDKLASWVTQWLMDRQRRIQPQAAAILGDYLGADLSKVVNELEKLMLNVPGNAEISLAHIAANIGISKDFNVYELNTALGKRDRYKAFQIADYFASNPKNNPLPLVLGALGGYFTKVLKYHYLPDKNPQAAAKELGVHSFFVREYEVAARHYSRPKAFEIISLLANYDLKSKGLGSGDVPPGELLKELVIKILN